MEKELTKCQSAAIGAVALAYNEVEVALDALLSAVVRLPHDGSSSISREVKIASITKAIASAGLEVEDQKQIEQALASFRDFTAYRDAINHVRLINLMSRGNSNLNFWKDKYVTAASDKALNIFYDHLIALEKGLSSAAMLVQAISVLKSTDRSY
jgi:hypothetical protein